MNYVDLNCDLGESFGSFKVGSDDKIIPLISSANVACGFHAGDPDHMNKTVILCSENNVRIGAHPGYNDLQGFGRRSMNLSLDEIRNIMLYQIGALNAFCIANGVKMQHVKPHGALYNMAAKSSEISDVICQSIKQFDDGLILLGLSGSEMEKAAKRAELRFASEVFADRAYEDDGSLVSRSKPNSSIKDENIVVERLVKMIKEHVVYSVNGKQLKIDPVSVCVHGDGEKALLFVKRIVDEFKDNDICIKSLDELV